jgi:hypothetical protein
MSAYCHCFNPEDAFVAGEEAATESVDTFADLPPLVPAEAPPKPKPLFSAADTKDFIVLYASKQRDRMTALYQHHLTDAINDLLEQRGDTLKEEMRAVIERADGVEQLSIVLFRYSKAIVTNHHPGSYTDDDGNWWTSIHAYCDSLTTTLGGVGVDYIVRKTHFLKQLVERIGDPKHFIIKKQVHAPEEHDAHKIIHMTLWLEFWPKGVTDRRRRECEP